MSVEEWGLSAVFVIQVSESTWLYSVQGFFDNTGWIALTETRAG
jgi:hypothetical protein